MAGRPRRSAQSANRARETFVATLAATGSVTKSAEAAGIDRDTAYLWRQKDAEFAKLWEAALETSIDALEQEARRRGFVGVDKPVHYKGKRVDVIREYSDRMLELLLKAHRPDKYRERVSTEHSGTLNVSVADLARMLRGNDNGE